MFIKKELLPAKRQEDLNLRKKAYPKNPEKKQQAVKRRYDD